MEHRQRSLGTAVEPALERPLSLGVFQQGLHGKHRSESSHGTGAWGNQDKYKRPTNQEHETKTIRLTERGGGQRERERRRLPGAAPLFAERPGMTFVLISKAISATPFPTCPTKESTRVQSPSASCTRSQISSFNATHTAHTHALCLFTHLAVGGLLKRVPKNQDKQTNPPPPSRTSSTSANSSVTAVCSLFS